MSYQITLRYSDGVTRAMPVAAGQTMLDAADSLNVPIVSECQSGVCGTCVGRCVDGAYDAGHTPGLSQHERDEGRILCCQALAKSDCTIELDYPFAGNAAHLVSGTARLAELERLSPNTVRLVLDVSAMPEALVYKAGQFAQIRVPGGNVWRSYSFLTDVADEGRLEFLIRLQPHGAMSDYLTAHAKVGDLLDIRGGKGGFYLRDTQAPVLLVAGGTGLSGVLAIARQLARQKHTAPVRLLYGVTEAEDLVLTERLVVLEARMADFKWQAIVQNPSSDWTGKRGFVTDLLDDEILSDGHTEAYLCGPAPMVEAVRERLDKRGHRAIELYFEKFLPTGSRRAAETNARPAIDMARMAGEGARVALVIGGSIAGMATARVLADHYDRVIIIEKDQVHHRMEGRPGAAQGWHLHHLLIAGQRELEKVFPGIIDDMVKAGAFRVDMGEQYRLMLAGSWKKVVQSGIEIICASRPLLEWCVRRRLDDETRITYLYGQEVTDLVIDEATGAVRGVVVAHEGVTRVIAAEFIVDASGKNTPVPALLGKQGWPVPEVEEDCLNCFYSSMRHKVPEGRAWDDKVMVIAYAHRPYQRYYAAQYYTDTSRRILSTSLVGYNCYDPPRNAKEFRDFARRMPTPLIGDELDDLEPCSEVYNFRYPEMRRYHYARLKTLPAGLVALGDALCSADPVSGVGMTKALLELSQLRTLLGTHSSSDPDLAPLYYRRVAKIADRVWFVVREQNLRYQWIKDGARKRVFYFRALNWYVDRVLERAHEDPAMYRLYLAMTHLIATPAVLMRPDVVAKVLGQWLKTKLSFRPTLIEQNFGHAPRETGTLPLANADLRPK